MQVGYDNTSIDAILERSGGSKATLYNYFPTKEDLFRAVVDSLVMNTEYPSLDTAADVRTTLIHFAVDRVNAIFSAQHRAVLRLVIAERDRFPDLAETYYRHGPLRGYNLLRDYLDRLRALRMLEMDDVDRATDAFVGMLLHRWYKELLLLGRPSPSSEAIERHASEVVSLFLKPRQPR